MAVTSGEFLATIPPGRTWESPRPYFDKNFASACNGRGAVRPTRVPGFAELSGCVVALSALSIAEEAAVAAREAARFAIKVATESAIASITQDCAKVRELCSETACPIADSSSARTLAVLVSQAPSQETEISSTGTDLYEKMAETMPLLSSKLASHPKISVLQSPSAAHDAVVRPATLQQQGEKAVPSSPSKFGHLPTPRNVLVSQSSSEEHDIVDTCAASREKGLKSTSSRPSRSPTKGQSDFKAHSGLFSFQGAWICPGSARRRINKHCVDVTKGDHLWSAQIEQTLPHDSAGHNDVVNVLSTLPSPRIVAMANSGRLAGETRTQDSMRSLHAVGESLETLESRLLEACDVDPGSNTWRSHSGFGDSFDQFEQRGDEKWNTLGTSESVTSLRAPSHAETSDIATTAAGDTEEPSERSFTLRADASLESLFSLGSHRTSATLVTSRTSGANSLPSFVGVDSVSPDVDVLTSHSPENLPYPPPKQPQEIPTPRSVEPPKPGMVPLSFLRSVYGGGDRKISRRRQATGSETSLTPRSSRTPLRPLKPAFGALRSEARFERKHLAALATLSQDNWHVQASSQLQDEIVQDTNSVTAVTMASELNGRCVEEGCLSPAGRRNSWTRRNSDTCRDLCKAELPLPPLIHHNPRPPSFRNMVCPFSQKQIEEGIMLYCGHRFSAEHLDTAIASSERMELAPPGFIVCPLCATTQRYGPDPDVRNPDRKTHPTIFSDHKRAHHGLVQTRNWNVQNTLPANV